MRINKYKTHQGHQDFITRYGKAVNAATGSEVDPNANVEKKSIATLETELFKRDAITINRLAMYQKLQEMYGTDLAEEYLRQLEEHEIYRHDETAVVGKPYCASVTLYPFLCTGNKSIGGTSDAPKNLAAFNGAFVNLVFALAAQFAGACLHKDQRLKISDGHSLLNPTAKEFVESFSLDKSFANHQGEWEYADVSAQNYAVVEQNRLVKINKVYRRKYDGPIYEIRTSSGLYARVSEDHLFKTLFRGRELALPAKELCIGDTLFCEKDYLQYIDFSSDDYLKGQFIGYVAGNGYICNKNSFSVAINYDHIFIAERIHESLARFWNQYGELKDGHRCFKYEKHSRELVSMIQSEFLPCERLDAFHKNVDLSGKSLNWMVGFLDGLCASDGCYSGKTLRLSLVNRPQLETVKTILDRLDISCSEIKTTPAHDNKADLFTLSVPIRAIKYLELTRQKPSKNAIFATRVNSSREIYYYGENAFKFASSSARTDVMANSCGNHRGEFHTDVISAINVVPNDDAYVYEIETSSHWYNCGGLITHNCSTPEWLSYTDYFIRKEFGNDYYLRAATVVDLSNRHRTIDKVITDAFEQVVYSLNQPAAARGNQSVFFNIAYFDEPYFKGMFEHFVFPDGTLMQWDSVNWLQKRFMRWFNEERKRKLLTFPVETLNLLDNGKEYVDPEWADYAAEMWAAGHSFFVYRSDSVDSLASCCRLRNELQDNTFSFTLGAGGVSTGSKCVMTININRLVQDAIWDDGLNDVRKAVEEQVSKLHKYLLAFNEILMERQAAGLLPVYDAGFVTPDKQYLTIGINGFLEGAEALGIEPDPANPEYVAYAEAVLEPIYRANKAARSKGIMFNTEMVPAESLGVKNAAWDMHSKLNVPRECYNSYFYRVEDPAINVLDKLILHGRDFTRYLDGGSACHINLDEHLSKAQYRMLLDDAIRTGCNYFTFNVPNTLCKACGFISKHKLDRCPRCNSYDLDYATRIIGYLKLVSRFDIKRQEEEARRHYAHMLGSNKEETK